MIKAIILEIVAPIANGFEMSPIVNNNAKIPPI